jgi:hypothetical protein
MLVNGVWKENWQPVPRRIRSTPLATCMNFTPARLFATLVRFDALTTGYSNATVIP